MVKTSRGTPNQLKILKSEPRGENSECIEICHATRECILHLVRESIVKLIKAATTPQYVPQSGF